jgi:hypothetical protein
MEEAAAHPIDHGFQCAALGIGDHRRPGGHGLHRNDAEVFHARKDERPAGGQLLANHLEGLAPQQGDVGPGHGAQRFKLLALADHGER